MFTIDLTIRYLPIPISIQKNDATEAQDLYQKILGAMTAETPQVIELTCDKEEDKKIAVIGNQINSIIISEKSGSSATAKVPGFFASVTE